MFSRRIVGAQINAENFFWNPSDWGKCSSAARKLKGVDINAAEYIEGRAKGGFPAPPGLRGGLPASALWLSLELTVQGSSHAQ